LVKCIDKVSSSLYIPRMALPTNYTRPKDAAELERRKILASELKQFAQRPDAYGKQTPADIEATKKSLMGEAAQIGVAAQMKDMYAKYKSEGASAGLPELAGPPAPSSMGMPPPPAEPAPPRQINTPGLDRLAALQGSPMGSVSSRGPRSLESESGKTLRAARKLQRMGFEGAANQIALGGGVRSLTEPKIKTQEFRGLEQQVGDAATEEAAELEQFKRNQRAFQKKLLEQQTKDLEAGNYDFRKYGAQAPTQ